MPRERALPPPLRTSIDEIQTGDQVLVRNAVFGNDHLASVIEIKEVEEGHGREQLSSLEEHKKERSRESQMPELEQSTARPEGQIAENQQMSSGEAGTSRSPAEVKTTEEGPVRKKAKRRKLHYYVHYVDTDRRLDEWVDASRIVIPSDPDLPQTPDPFGNNRTLLTRSQRRLNEDFRHVPKSFDDLDATTRKLELEHEQRTKVKNVDQIQFGEWEIDAWYFSPFPLSITINRNKIYFCEFCLWYSADQLDYTCHFLHKCPHGPPPPGEQIYEDGNLVVYEVRGRENKDYCQSLCLLSKLFLDHKTLYYDVEGFLFYVLCELDERRTAHPVGHFSKELNSVNNLACIMVLPPYQRNGYGKLLIQLSYCLSEQEGVVGTPEKPLSDLGKVSYRSYWWWVLVGVLDREQANIEQAQHLCRANISVAELSRLSGIHVDDIVETFKTLQLIKYWRGDHVVRISSKIVSQIKQLHLFHPPKLILRKSAVHWRPSSAAASNGVGDRDRKRSIDRSSFGRD